MTWSEPVLPRIQAGSVLVHSCLLVEAREGLIRRIWVVTNPLELVVSICVGRRISD
jgi:hypothetical protein